jgi:hypothetical protein
MDGAANAAVVAATFLKNSRRFMRQSLSQIAKGPHLINEPLPTQCAYLYHNLTVVRTPSLNPTLLSPPPMCRTPPNR